jgi:hypothetical protein
LGIPPAAVKLEALKPYFVAFVMRVFAMIITIQSLCVLRSLGRASPALVQRNARVL